MSIGGAFPRDTVRASVIRQLRPGTVVKFVATLDDGEPKEKRYVVVWVRDDILALVMNSEIHPIIQRNPDALKCQVTVKAALHSFADKDCHFDCSRVRQFALSDVVEQLADRPSWILGRISTELCDQIQGALKHSLLIPADVASKCCDSLAAETFDV